MEISFKKGILNLFRSNQLYIIVKLETFQILNLLIILSMTKVCGNAVCNKYFFSLLNTFVIKSVLII